MKLESHKKAIAETLAEISSALEDPRGLVSHQIRLASMLSVGTVNLIELFLHGKGILKEGAKIDHRWLKREKENAKGQIINALITTKLPEELDILLELARTIEIDRDNLVYGMQVKEDTILSRKINTCVEIKKNVGFEDEGDA